MGGYVFSFYLLLLLWHKQQFRVGKLKADFELREGFYVINLKRNKLRLLMTAAIFNTGNCWGYAIVLGSTI
jgi:hypothetical protein